MKSHWSNLAPHFIYPWLWFRKMLPCNGWTKEHLVSERNKNTARHKAGSSKHLKSRTDFGGFPGTIDWLCKVQVAPWNILCYNLHHFACNFKKCCLCLAALGPLCGMWAFSGCGAQATHCSDFSCCEAWTLGHAGFSICRAWAQSLWFLGSGAQTQRAHKLSCPKACGIFPGQGSNLCPLPWQADS